MTEAAPLSFAQLRMWLFAQLEPASSHYNQLRVTRWRGPLQVPALERALSELIARYDVLRARFWSDEGGVFQRAADATPVTIPVEAVEWSPPETAEKAAARRALAVGGQPFDLERGLLVRAVLLRLQPTEHHLVLVVHHIASDEMSARLLLQELCALYAAHCAGDRPLLPLSTRQYAEYAARQQERVGTRAEAEDLSYWREQLRGAPPLLQLPTDRPRPARASYEGGEVGFHLPAPTVDRIASLCRSERVSPFMVLLAAFQAVLARWSSRTDLIVGVPIAGRTEVELERAIGCFANTLVLRTDASGDPSLRDLLRRARAAVLDGLAHQELPFERLVQDLHPARNPAYHPVFQVLFVLRDFSPLELAAPGMEIEYLPTGDRGRALVDLGLEVDRTRTGYRVELTYNATLFDRSTVERLGTDFLAVLEAMLEDPAVRLSQLPAPLGVLPVGDAQATARALAVLEQLSEEEVKRLLAEAGESPA
jgi:hypothetical protein